MAKHKYRGKTPSNFGSTARTAIQAQSLDSTAAKDSSDSGSPGSETSTALTRSSGSDISRAPTSSLSLLRRVLRLPSQAATRAAVRQSTLPGANITANEQQSRPQVVTSVNSSSLRRASVFTQRNHPAWNETGRTMGSEFPDGGICTLSCVKVHADLIYRSLLAKEYTTLDSYADLEQLELYEGQSLGLLGNSVKQRLLRMLQGEMEPITEVGVLFRERYPDLASVMKIDGLCLGSMANCVSLWSLHNSLQRTHDKDFAILTIHPDDWVAGQEAVEPDASWMKHGKLAWNSIPITNLEDREHGLKEALIGLPHKTCFIRAPSVVNGILSPVVDHYVIELEDSTAAPLLKFFPNACQFLATHLAAPRRKAMAHCKAGKSRGPAFTLAFMIYRYYHTVIENNPQYPSITPSQKAKVVDRLDAVINDFMGFLMEIRPCISADNKFRTQLRLWAWQLVHKTRPAINPERPRPGGGDMRDAAIIEFYIREQRPFRNLVEHWLKRRFSGETRWRAAEMEKARMEGTAKGQDPKVKMEEYIHYWKRVMQTEAEE